MTTNQIHTFGRFVAVALLSVSPVLLTGCPKGQMPEKPDYETRFVDLESKEEIYSTILDFTKAADSGNPAQLATLSDRLEPDFTLDMTNFDGNKEHFDGPQGLVQGFGPMLAESDANIVPGAIGVELEGNNATAEFDFISSVKPGPEYNLQPEARVLIICDGTATFVREGKRWRMSSMTIDSRLAYPGSL
jgi:hypothetical protein